MRIPSFLFAAITLAFVGPSFADLDSGSADLKTATAPETQVIPVQMRDLFVPGGKPSAKAVFLSGRQIAIAGFAAEPPDEDSPFLVLVGAPTAFCPYCATIDEQDHLPYILVYPEDVEVVGDIDKNARIRVIGELETSHGFDQDYGVHNDIRLTSALVARDTQAVNPARPVRDRRLGPPPSAALEAIVEE